MDHRQERNRTVGQAFLPVREALVPHDRQECLSY